MNSKEFDTEMIRLKNTFGEKNYSEERMRIIFKETQFIDFAFFRSCVDELIGSSKFTPLLPEFREIATKFREIKERQKDQAKQHRYDNSDGLNAEESSMILKKIIARGNNLISDKEWEEWKALIRSSYKFQTLLCKRCEDSGLIYESSETGGEYVFRCTCKKGTSRPDRYPFA